MSLGPRFSAVPVRLLYRRPHCQQRKPCTVHPARSVVEEEWQCGQSRVALLISQNRPETLSANASPGKLPRDLTEPAQKHALEEPRAGAPDKASADCNQPQEEISPSPTST